MVRKSNKADTAAVAKRGKENVNLGDVKEVKKQRTSKSIDVSSQGISPALGNELAPVTDNKQVATAAAETTAAVKPDEAKPVAKKVTKTTATKKRKTTSTAEKDEPAPKPDDASAAEAVKDVDMKDANEKVPTSGKDSDAEQPAAGNRKRAVAIKKSYLEAEEGKHDKADMLAVKKEAVVDSEEVALEQTGGKGITQRRLTDFAIVDAAGNPTSLERTSVQPDAVWLQGVIQPSEGKVARAAGRRLERSFGPVKEWSIKYTNTTATVHVKTSMAEYELVKPHSTYRRLHELLEDQVILAHQIWLALTPAAGGIMSASFDEVMAKLSRANVGKKYGGTLNALLLSSRFLLSQLTAMGGHDTTGKGADYRNTPFGNTLAAEAAKSAADHVATMAGSGGGIAIRDVSSDQPAGNSGQEDAAAVADAEFAARLQAKLDTEAAASGGGGGSGKGRGGSAKQQAAPYIYISEQEIADDYPEPTQYNKEREETDELLLTDVESLAWAHPDDLPRHMLNDFAFYNLEGFLASLELVPMFTGVDHTLEIFGSGVVMEDTGDFSAGVAVDAETAMVTDSNPAATQQGGSGSGSSAAQGSSNSSSEPQGQDMRLYLSQVREWFVEWAAEMLSISIRTDCAWYRLAKPSQQYAPWFKTVIKVAQLAVTILRLLTEESRASRLSFQDIIKKLSELPETSPCFIGRRVETVQRFVVVHGQIILNQFKHYPKKEVQRSSFVIDLRAFMEQRKHHKLYMPKAVRGRGSVAAGPRVRADNPMKSRAPSGLRAKPMPATATAMVKSVWRSYFFGHSIAARAAEAEAAKEAANAEPAVEVADPEPEPEEEPDAEGNIVENGLQSPTPSKNKARRHRPLTDDEGDEEAEVQSTAKAAEVAKKLSEVAKKPAAAKAKKGVKKNKKPIVDELPANFEGEPLRTDAAGRVLYGAAKVGDVCFKLGDVITFREEKQADTDDNASDSDVEMTDAAAASGAEGSEAEVKGLMGIVKCIYKDKQGNKKVQARVVVRGSDTVLDDVASDGELFVTDEVEVMHLGHVAAVASAVHMKRDWDKTNISKNRLLWYKEDEARRLRNEEHLKNGEPLEYFYRSLYKPEEGMFCAIPSHMMTNNGNYIEPPPKVIELGLLPDNAGFIKDNIEYHVGDIVYTHPEAFGSTGGKPKKNKKKPSKTSGKGKRSKSGDNDDGSSSSDSEEEQEEGAPSNAEQTDYHKDVPEYLKDKRGNVRLGKGSSNVGRKPFGIAQIVGVAKSDNGKPVSIRVRRFYRPEDISAELATQAGWWEVYAGPVPQPSASGAGAVIHVDTIVRKAAIKLKGGRGPVGDIWSAVDTFVCVGSYDPATPGKPQQPPTTLAVSEQKAAKGKGSSGVITSTAPTDPDADSESDSEDEYCDAEHDNVDGTVRRKAKSSVEMNSLDIFAGCGGLSEGMHQAGVAVSKWAIEYDQPAADAFAMNNPDATVFCNNCNVLLQAAMAKAGQLEDCDSCQDCKDAVAKLDPQQVAKLPEPGQVEFIMGGPPCQGYSGMNRFNKGNWSMVQNSMVMAYLSYCDFYRPRYFLLENVRNFVSHNKSFTFRLTIRTLVEMGYQVRFGVLNAGNYGVPQSRKRTIIWAAAPDEQLPAWPKPRHVFHSPQLTINLPGGVAYTAVPTEPGHGAPLRAVTVKDAIIGDLPPVENGAEEDKMSYAGPPVTAYQRFVRRPRNATSNQQQAHTDVLIDHVGKKLNEINLLRCKYIPKERPGADWRELELAVQRNPELERPFSHDSKHPCRDQPLVPWCLPNTRERHNDWRGLYGRLDLQGHFPTSTTDPNPMGKVGTCLHPNQDRIVTVRECARSQGFPDEFQFAGNVHNRHRQVGNAVPPPLAFALGLQLRKKLEARKKEREQAALEDQM